MSEMVSSFLIGFVIGWLLDPVSEFLKKAGSEFLNAKREWRKEEK